VLEPGGAGVAEQTARRLCCDASVVAVDIQGSSSRKKRLPNLALRRALAVRDRCCVFPGCTCDVHLEAHHIKHWLDGGETTGDNLILLCSLCRERHKLHYADFLIMPLSFHNHSYRRRASNQRHL
jgi:hypothetical protein